MQLPKKGSGNAARLYKVLELEPTATEDEVKRAYKKMALKFHPDKNPGNEEKFKEINTAYNILIDPQKKEIYDSYGEEGLALYENGMFGEDGELMHIIPYLENPVYIGLFACVVLIGWILTFLFALFIVLKVDGDINWNWGTIFVPLWILNVGPLCFSVCSVPQNIEHRLKGFKALVSSTQYFALLVFQILLCIQLQREENDRSSGHHTAWKWAIVFIPIYYYELVHIIKRIANSGKAKYDEEVETHSSGFNFGCQYFGYLLRKLFIPAMRVWFIVFLIVKLDHKTSWSWWINAIPLFVGIAWKVFIRFADDMKVLRKTTSAEEHAKTKSMIVGISVLISLFLAVVLAFIILVVVKLDGSSITLAKVFIPPFIVFGLGCCCACCLPLLCCCCAGKAEDPENPFEYEPTEPNNNNSNSEDKKYIDNTHGYQNETTATTSTSTPPPTESTNNNNSNSAPAPASTSDTPEVEEDKPVMVTGDLIAVD